MLKKKLSKYLIYLLPLALLIIFSLLLITIKKWVPTSSTLPPELTPTPTPGEYFPPTRWSTDSGVLKIEEEITILEEKLNTIDLYEVKLQPPYLDIKVDL